jgi:DNA repair protein RadC
MAADEPHYHGHRERLRKRLFESGPGTLQDYEILEILLYAANPRADTKPVAKALIEEFKDFAGVATASREALLSVKGVGESGAAQIAVIREAALRLLRAEAQEGPVLSSWQKLVEYCQAQLQFEPIENFHVLFLDRKNKLIKDERQQRGTVDHTPLYPREVVKRALELGASALILVHNHPSGDPTPSKADVEVTKEVAKAAALLGVTLHDHLIIGRGKHTSLRSLGVI